MGLLTDATLRRNLSLKIAHLSQSSKSPSRLFRDAAAGNPNLFLLNDILRDTETLTGIEQPKFLDIYPNHQFGLVKRSEDFTGLTMDRYKKMAEQWKDVKLEEDDYLFISTTLNGEADCELDEEDLMPDISVGMSHRTKQKTDMEAEEGNRNLHSGYVYSYSCLQ
ncbi:hypothetical protein M422DRAFT_274046 [Sphaerobolus stellatus SS14]|uniref:Uncharacterized protein n=1 Tax=Sphaerobolus stellatus (strain SS14) TaxID=990650 RepID=A0A0C9UIK6_SPHS4|nr:hypothetical protein M422DRAFT_274046 [Sphaerobolus stellatus SS14]